MIIINPLKSFKSPTPNRQNRNPIDGKKIQIYMCIYIYVYIYCNTTTSQTTVPSSKKQWYYSMKKQVKASSCLPRYGHRVAFAMGTSAGPVRLAGGRDVKRSTCECHTSPVEWSSCRQMLSIYVQNTHTHTPLPHQQGMRERERETERQREGQTERV